MACPRVIGMAEAQEIQRRDGTRAHGEDVAQDPAYPGRRALVRFDIRGVVVALHLEHAGKPVADVDHAGILARALDDPWRIGGKPAQMEAGRFVGAVLVPHRRDDAELGQGRRAADEADETLVLVGLEAVLLDEFGRDLDVVAHLEPQVATRLSNRPRPSVPPTRSSIRFSGCGIIPRTLSRSE